MDVFGLSAKSDYRSIPACQALHFCFFFFLPARGAFKKEGGPNMVEDGSSCTPGTSLLHQDSGAVRARERVKKKKKKKSRPAYLGLASGYLVGHSQSNAA